MIDGIRPRRSGEYSRPADRHLTAKIVVGDHSGPVSPFKPPEVVAAEDQSKSPVAAGAGSDNPGLNGDGTAAGNTTSMPASSHDPTGPKERTHFWDKLRNLDKKQWLIIIAIAVVLIGSSVTAFLLLHHPKPATKPKTVTKATVQPPPKPTTEASKLTGLQVDPAVNQRPVTAIMIENSPDARPQSALDQAGVVFEAIAEGGITRFLTLWQDTEPDYIGPVRSVRPYYIQWAMGFDAPIAHVGGSPDGLASLKSWGAKDLDQFAGGAYFWRISTRYAPHNVYTSMAKLREYESKKGYTTSNYTGFNRKAEKAASPATATAIDFNVSGADYNPHYDYDAATNSYKRSEGGAPHMEINQAGTQTQISPKVVVALILPQGSDGKYTTYQTLGSGHMYVFQDGALTEGTWRKDNNSAQFVFTDAAGATLKLNPGQAWITILGDNSRVTYK